VKKRGKSARDAAGEALSRSMSELPTGSTFQQQKRHDGDCALPKAFEDRSNGAGRGERGVHTVYRLRKIVAWVSDGRAETAKERGRREESREVDTYK